MQLRQYLDLLKRHRWLILQAIAITAIVAGVVAGTRPEVYEATSRVLLRPNDPNEQLGDQPVAADNQPDRFVSAQADIVESVKIAKAAAVVLGEPKADPEVLLKGVSARQSTGTNIVRISARDGKAERARDVANAFTTAYIENRRQFAIAGIDTAVNEIEGKLGQLQGRIAAIDGALSGGPVPDGFSGAPEPLRAARTAASIQYESLYSRQQDLVVERSLKRGQAELIADAALPGAPASPKPLRDAALGGVIGLLIGLGLSYAREQLGDKLRSREELETLTGSRVLAELPFEAEASEHPETLSIISRPRGLLAEAVRSLRSSIDFLAMATPMRTIVVTSSVPGDGKSLVSANLAAAYALSGRKTLLVMADLRRPRLSTHLPDDDRKGLSELVFGPVVPLEPQLLRTAVPNLLLLPPGPLPPNPAELLASARATQIFAELADLVDVVVIDTPPLMAVTDGAVLANRADGVVLVTAADETTRPAILRSHQILETPGTNLLGIVLNKVRSTNAAYYSGYYSSESDRPRESARAAKSAKRQTEPPSPRPERQPEPQPERVVTAPLLNWR